MPDILQQVGAQQYEYLKQYATAMHKPDLDHHHHHHDHEHSHEEAEEGAAGEKADDEEIPDLVETNFEEVSKKE